MRIHAALHLLGAVLAYGVTGGNISAEKSRLVAIRRFVEPWEAVPRGLGRFSINLMKSKDYWALESNMPVYAGACRSTAIVLSQCMISTIFSSITNIMIEKVEAACRMSYPIST